MGKAVRASALILLLACSAQAGWMGNGVAPPPPTPEPQTVEQGQPVQEPSVDDSAESGATGIIVETVLDLLADVLSLV